MTETRKDALLDALAAALVLVIAMSFGRFAFTGLYPAMVAHGQISVEGGSYAASANYAGYLAGALLTAFWTSVPSRKQCGWSAALTVITLGLLGVALPEWLMVVLRGLAGVFSAFGLVGASHWLIQERQHRHGAPAMFAGVGAGIFVSAEMIAAGNAAGLSSYAIWLVLAAAALVLTLAATALQARTAHAGPVSASPPAAFVTETSGPMSGPQLVAAYGLAGLGYIITATYLPLLLRSTFAGIDPAHLWAVFGLSAAPSCFLWHALHVRWGTRRSLMTNLAIQAVGVALPVVHAPSAYLLSALLVGGTFMGTVTIALPAARKLAAGMRLNMIAVMTAAYGTGQIIGPLIAGMLYQRTQSFDASLLIASGALGAATVLCAKSKR